MPESMFTASYQRVIEAVVDLRHRAGLTQRQLAEKLNREQSFVGRIETGQRRLDLVELIWICNVCGADPKEEIAALVDALARAVPPRRRRRGK